MVGDPGSPLYERIISLCLKQCRLCQKNVFTYTGDSVNVMWSELNCSKTFCLFFPTAKFRKIKHYPFFKHADHTKFVCICEYVQYWQNS